MTKAAGTNFLLLALCSVLFGCASSGEGGSSGGTMSVIGDQDGGKVPNGVGSQQAIAFNSINQHCAQFGRKGFITKMDFDSGTLTFECRVQKPKPST